MQRCYILIDDFKGVKAGNKFFVRHEKYTGIDFIIISNTIFYEKEIIYCFNRYFKRII